VQEHLDLVAVQAVQRSAGEATRKRCPRSQENLTHIFDSEEKGVAPGPSPKTGCAVPGEARSARK